MEDFEKAASLNHLDVISIVTKSFVSSHYLRKLEDKKFGFGQRAVEEIGGHNLAEFLAKVCDETAIQKAEWPKWLEMK